MVKTHSFKGFGDWVEVFAAGQQTASDGTVKQWTPEELDQMVANHTSAPLVFGHPKTDDPAYGWTEAMKRSGDKLLAKFRQVPQAVSDLVSRGHYPNRSIKIAKTDAGWKLVHVGLLGAAPPAVAGLAPIQFDADAPGEVYQFDADDARNLGLIARGMRNLRELILTKFGQADADTYMPQSQIDALMQAAADEAAEPDSSEGAQASLSSAGPSAAFSSTPTEQPVTDKTYTQAELDAIQAQADAEKQARETAETQLAEFAARDRLASAKAAVDELLTAGRLMPAQALGLAEFMASEDASQSFEFAAADGNKATRPRGDFLREFLGRLPVQIEFNRQRAGADGGVDKTKPESITKAAKAYMAAEKAKGNLVAWHEAVTHVMKDAG